MSIDVEDMLRHMSKISELLRARAAPFTTAYRGEDPRVIGNLPMCADAGRASEAADFTAPQADTDPHSDGITYSLVATHAIDSDSFYETYSAAACDR